MGLSEMIVRPDLVDEAKNFAISVFGFEEICTVREIVLLQLKDDKLAICASPDYDAARVLRENLEIYVRVKWVWLAMKRAAKAGCLCSEIKLVNEPWAVDMGHIIDPYGHLWYIQSHKSSAKGVFNISVGYLAVRFFHDVVWKPKIQPSIERALPLVRQVRQAKKVYDSGKMAVDFVAAATQNAREAYERLDSEAGKRYGDLLRDPDSSVAAYWHSFR